MEERGRRKDRGKEKRGRKGSKREKREIKVKGRGKETSPPI